MFLFVYFWCSKFYHQRLEWDHDTDALILAPSSINSIIQPNKFISAGQPPPRSTCSAAAAAGLGGDWAMEPSSRLQPPPLDHLHHLLYGSSTAGRLPCSSLPQGLHPEAPLQNHLCLPPTVSSVHLCLFALHSRVLFPLAPPQRQWTVRCLAREAAGKWLTST